MVSSWFFVVGSNENFIPDQSIANVELKTDFLKLKRMLLNLINLD